MYYNLIEHHVDIFNFVFQAKFFCRHVTNSFNLFNVTFIEYCSSKPHEAPIITIKQSGDLKKNDTIADDTGITIKSVHLKFRFFWSVTLVV